MIDLIAVWLQTKVSSSSWTGETTRRACQSSCQPYITGDDEMAGHAVTCCDRDLCNAPPAPPSTTKLTTLAGNTTHANSTHRPSGTAATLYWRRQLWGTGARVPSTSNNLLWSPYGIGQTIISLPCGFFFLSSSSFFFSSPNLIGRRLDVCHTSTHGVALVRI